MGLRVAARPPIAHFQTPAVHVTPDVEVPASALEPPNSVASRMLERAIWEPNPALLGATYAGLVEQETGEAEEPLDLGDIDTVYIELEEIEIEPAPTEEEASTEEEAPGVEEVRPEKEPVPPAPDKGAKPGEPAEPEAGKPKPEAAAPPGTAQKAPEPEPAKAAAAPARRGGAGRAGRGGAGGARPAAPATPPSTLDAWKASMDAATQNIAPGDTGAVKAAPGELAQKAAATEQQRAGERPDFNEQAKGQLPPDPKGAPPADQLDTKVPEGAVSAVTTAGKAKISNQTFPAMEPMPSGLVTAVPRPVVVPPPPPPPPPPGAVAAKAPAKGDPKAKKAADKVAEPTPVPPAKGTAGEVTVTDPGVASLEPLPPGQAVVIGDVAARLLAKAPVYAQEIVDAAGQPLDRNKSVDAFQAILKSKSKLATEQEGFTTELSGIAASAGVSAEQLKAKVAEQRAALAKAEADAGKQLDERATTAKETVKTRGSDDAGAITGAREAVDEEMLRKQEAARGSADPEVVNGRRDLYVQKITSIAAAGDAALTAAKERRTADLDQIAANQKTAYRKQVQDEILRVQGPVDPAQDQTAAKIAAQPLVAWSEKAITKTEGHLARLKRELGEEVDGLQTALSNAADDAREKVRDWAAEKLGHERSWWEQFWDMVMDWVAQGKANTAAWEAQRNADNRDKVAADLTMLSNLRDEMAKGNRDAIMAQLQQMSREQQAVAVAFLASGGRDALGAVATGLLTRVKAHRVPDLAKEVESEAIAKLGREDLNALGANQTRGFDAGLIVRDIRSSVKGWGTKEKKLFTALGGRTPLQIAAMRKAYAAVYPGDDMDKDIDADLSGSEQDRADALRSGDPTVAAVATLKDAMDGAGTDEPLIYATLRGKTPAEIDAIKAEYKKQYGVDLDTDLGDEMEDHELGQATALLDNDPVRADAEALKDAMEGAGTDEAAISAVYAQIRQEVEAKAAREGWTTAQVEAEVKRRNREVKKSYADAFAQGDEGALEADFEEELSGGELKLAIAADAGDQAAMDAAKLQIEHESLWTSDDTVNDVLKQQHARAEKEVMRDQLVEFNKRALKMTPAERKAAYEQMHQASKELVDKRAKENMAALKESYNADNGPYGFDFLIAFEVSGYSQDEALARIEAGGKLSDELELKYAIFGAGTNEKAIRDTLKGKSKKQIAEIKRKYKEETGNDLEDDLEGDLSGRDEADMVLLLENGDGTPEEKMNYLRARKEWELTEGTGDWGSLATMEEADVLSTTTVEAEAAYAEYDRLMKDPKATPEQREKALARFERWVDYGEKDIERHREELDAITDTLATVGAVVVGVAVTILTAGAAAPLVAGVATALGTSTVVVAGVAGAIAATATSMYIKEQMKGGSYGGEDIAIELAQGTAEAIVAAFTAGMGPAALKALAKSPAFAGLAKLAEGGVMSRMGGKAVESGIEGMIQGMPSGMMAAILNEDTWKSPNPLLVILEAGGQAAVQAAATAAAMGGAMEGFMVHPGAAGARRALGLPEPHVPVGAHPEVPAGGVTAEGATGVRPAAEVAPAEVRPTAEVAPAEVAPAEVRPAEVAPAEVRPAEVAPAEVRPAEVAPAEVQPAPEAAPEPTEARPAPREEPPQARTPGERTPESPDAVQPVEDIPEIDLPDGSIMAGGGDTPMSAADAQQMYENTIRETPNREAMILENAQTGERVVVQGDPAGAAPSPDVWAEFVASQMGGGDWQVVKHNHPVGDAGVTPVHERYPSGGGGDLAQAATDAMATGRPHEATIDITTESGPAEIRYGHDPGAEKPYWVDLPGPEGTRIPERFGSLEEYHNWYEQQTGMKMSGLEPTPAPVAPEGGPPPTTEAPTARTPKSPPEPVATPAPTEPPAKLPAGVRRSSLRDKAMKLINDLPPGERKVLMDALGKMSPEAAGQQLSNIGRLESSETLSELLKGRIEGARPEAGGEFGSPEQIAEHLADVSGDMLDVPEGRTAVPPDPTEVPPELVDPFEGLRPQERRPPPRIDPETPGVDRSRLRARMDPPEWAANDPRAWDAHHLIPVELQNNEVFEVLRNSGGWDHHVPENGIALPTRPDIPGAENLPMHQMTREAIAAQREQINAQRRAQGLPEIPMPDAQTMRDVQGHPVLNERGKQALDRMATMRLADLEPGRLEQLGASGRDLQSRLIDNPDLLRAEVERLQRQLAYDILFSGATVQP